MPSKERSCSRASRSPFDGSSSTTRLPRAITRSASWAKESCAVWRSASSSAPAAAKGSRSKAPLVSTRKRPSGSACTLVIILRADEKGTSPTRGSSASSASRVSPEAESRRTMAVSVASPTIFSPPAPSGSTVALLARARRRRRTSARGSSVRSPTSTAGAPGTQVRRTLMRFCVSVPVLSEQMTEVEPSVSTAGSLRMRACLCAMLRTPRVSVRVTMSCRVSGTAATARETAASIMAQNSSPCRRPVASSATAASTATALTPCTTRASLRCSGV